MATSNRIPDTSGISAGGDVTVHGNLFLIVNSQTFSSPAVDIENSSSRYNNPVSVPQNEGREGTSPRLADETGSLPPEGNTSQPDSQSSQVLPCCGYSQQELKENPAVLCRHVLKTSAYLPTDEWELIGEQAYMKSDSHGIKVGNKDVTLRTLLSKCSRKRLRHFELANVTLNNLKQGRSLLENGLKNRVNYPELEIVYMSLNYDNNKRAGKTLKKECMRSLLFFVPGEHKWNNLWNAPPKPAQVFLEVNGIVYIHVKKAAVGNALVLSEWRKLDADEYLRSEAVRNELHYFHCLGRSISLDLLSSCKGLKELNLHNCYFPTTGESVSNDVARRLCDALCELPNLSKLTFDAKRFQSSCFDLSFISKRNSEYPTLRLILGHTKIIWSNSSTTGDLEDLNSLAKYNFSKILLCKCQIDKAHCIYKETSRQFATEPQCGIIELEKRNTEVSLHFYEFKWMDNGPDAHGQMRPDLKTDYYHLFQLYNFYTPKYWESKMGSRGNTMNQMSTSLLPPCTENDDDQLRLLYSE